MQYRRDIDGLRAVAVIPVILFHAGVAGFSGGFVGVDVFFVISGFLITGLLLRDLEQGRFSIAQFYERRARRILPALFVVLVVCMGLSWLWLMPQQLADFFASAASVVVFLSNLFFMSQTGYFAPDSHSLPLVHTWSLGVEEQFYLFFPLLLWALRRRSRRTVVLVLTVLALASLALAEYGWRHSPDRAFFFSGTRFWEIFAGALCAFAPRDIGGRWRGGLALLGLALILGAIFGFDASVPTPSLYTAIPVLGTALVLLAGGPGSAVGRLLSLRALTGVGLISYSAYLWHQPVLVFAPPALMAAGPAVAVPVLLAVITVLAVASWRYVEQPFRAGPSPLLARRWQVFAAAGLCSAGLLAASVVGWWLDGAAWRLPERVQQIAAAGQIVSRECPDTAACPIGAVAGRASGLVLLGDSHAARYAVGLEAELTRAGLSAQLVTGSWCAPLVNFSTRSSDRNGADCARIADTTLPAVAQDPSVKTVILVAEWGNYAFGGRHLRAPVAYDYGGDGQVNRTIAGNEGEFSRAFDATMALFAAAGKRVVIVGPLPEYQVTLPETMAALALRGGDFNALRLPRAAFERRRAPFVAATQRWQGKVQVIDPTPLFCDEALCRPYDEAGLPLYQDDNHLTLRGIQRVMPMLMTALAAQ